MFNVFAFLLRPPTWLYVLLTKLLFFFPPSPHFFLFFLLLSISSSPNVHAKYVCPIDSSFTRFLFFFFSRIPNLPLRLLFCSLRARFRLGFLVQFFSTQRHSNILFSNRVFSLRVDSSEKQASNQIESGDSGGSAKREDALENASFREICLFTGLIYGERILLEPRGRRRGRRKGWGGGR